MKNILSILFIIFLFGFSACEYNDWDEVTIYIVAFDPDGGSINGDPKELNVWVYETWCIEYLPVPEKEDYTFSGWFTKKDGLGDEFTNTTRVFDNILVYAHWL